MVNMLTLSAVDRGFEPRSGQTKDYLIGISCFTDKHAALRRKSKDWLARNQDNVSQWGDMSIKMWKVNGRRTTDNGRRTTDNGRQTTDDGRQVMAKAHIAFGKVS
jgi:hypothetical protein